MTEDGEIQDRVTAICDCLSRPRRRYALQCLQDSPEPRALADLAADVATIEAEYPHSEASAETVQDVHLSLYHNHVPKLADAGLVSYDADRGHVEFLGYPPGLDAIDTLVLR